MITISKMDNDPDLHYKIANHLEKKIEEEYQAILASILRVQEILSVAEKFGSKPYKFDATEIKGIIESVLWSGSMDVGDENPNVSSILERSSENQRKIITAMIEEIREDSQ